MLSHNLANLNIRNKILLSKYSLETTNMNIKQSPYRYAIIVHYLFQNPICFIFLTKQLFHNNCYRILHENNLYQDNQNSIAGQQRQFQKCLLIQRSSV
ncbi:hypothetical protein pb186bvf_016608 [Paramecium bursaria]